MHRSPDQYIKGDLLTNKTKVPKNEMILLNLYYSYFSGDDTLVIFIVCEHTTTPFTQYKSDGPDYPQTIL